MHFNKRDLFTIPNIMSYFRILLVPLFVTLYNCERTVWAIIVVAVSALTDILDGKVARKTNQVTDIGKIIDPVADKAMQFAMLFCVIIRYKAVVFLLAIYAAKEIVSLAFSGFLFVHKKNIGGAMWCGKACTVILYAVMLVFLVCPWRLSNMYVGICIGVSAAFMMLAFVVYMNAYIKLIIEYRDEKNEGRTGD